MSREPERWRAMDRAIRERGGRIEVFWNASGKPGVFTARVHDSAGRFLPLAEEGDIWAAWGDTAATALDALASVVFTGKRPPR